MNYPEPPPICAILDAAIDWIYWPVAVCAVIALILTIHAVCKLPLE